MADLKIELIKYVLPPELVSYFDLVGIKLVQVRTDVVNNLIGFLLIYVLRTIAHVLNFCNAKARTLSVMNIVQFRQNLTMPVFDSFYSDKFL